MIDVREWIFINKSSNNGFNFKRFKIPTKLVDAYDGKKNDIIYINPPELCPICGSKEIAGKVKLPGLGGSFGEKQKYISVLMCKEHGQLAKKSNSPRFLYIMCILFISIFLLIRFLSELINNSIILISLAGILGGSGAFISLYILYKDIRFQGVLEDYIVLQYSNTDSIISIKRSDWAEEFKKLNEHYEDKLDLELVEEIKRKYYKNMKKFVIVISSLMIFLVISLILQLIIIVLPLTLILVILAFYFVGKDIQYRGIMNKMNAKDYGIWLKMLWKILIKKF